MGSLNPLIFNRSVGGFGVDNLVIVSFRLSGSECFRCNYLDARASVEECIQCTWTIVDGIDSGWNSGVTHLVSTVPPGYAQKK